MYVDSAMSPITLACISALGMVSCAAVIVANTVRPILQHAPARFVRFRALFTLLQSGTLFAHACWRLARPPMPGECDHGGLDALFVIAEALETGICGAALAQVLHMLSLLRDPFRPRRHVRSLQVIVCLLTGAEPLSILILLSRPSASSPSTSAARWRILWCTKSSRWVLLAQTQWGILVGVNLSSRDTRRRALILGVKPSATSDSSRLMFVKSRAIIARLVLVETTLGCLSQSM